MKEQFQQVLGTLQQIGIQSPHLLDDKLIKLLKNAEETADLMERGEISKKRGYYELQILTLGLTQLNIATIIDNMQMQAVNLFPPFPMDES